MLICVVAFVLHRLVDVSCRDHCLTDDPTRGLLGREHIVLERGRLAERWRSERWDSLTLLSPNWMTQLPGYGYHGDDPDGFIGREEVVQLLEDYAAFFNPPLRCGTRVESLQRKPGTDRYLARTADETIEALNVVVATGEYQEPRIPPLSAVLPAGVLQLPSRDYRNPSQLPPGAVLVVGSAASGLQICEDLQEAGRAVYVSVGRGQRWPRRYRGRDFMSWLQDMGLLDDVGQRYYMDPRYGCTGVLTGVRGGHDLDYDRLAAEGVTLLGHLVGAENGVLVFADDLRESLALWDESRAIFARMIDDYIQRTGLDAAGRGAVPCHNHGMAEPGIAARAGPGCKQNPHHHLGDRFQARLRLA
jgi:putative flavoprotein involved in K+ transport